MKILEEIRGAQSFNKDGKFVDLTELYKLNGSLRNNEIKIIHPNLYGKFKNDHIQ